ncbi:hypothetical protein [Stenotrophomonas geniculata]|uniref:hypothetical protein n=1 Tax=Stenotrophomonas geniculata TaxID=86188 RepID=UPI0038B474E1
MKILSNSVVLSLLLVGCGNGEPQEERLSRNEKHDEAPSLALSEEELERQISMAENGSAEARLELEWHYSTRATWSGIATGLRRESHEWTLVQCSDWHCSSPLNKAGGTVSAQCKSSKKACVLIRQRLRAN